MEPQWDQWLQISLVMRKDTGDELRIELLRPGEWLTERWQFVASRPEGWCVTALDDEPAEDATAGLTPLLEQCGAPWRAYRQEMAVTALELAASGYELVGLTLELDLHEIGAVGEAMVLDIQPAPPVRLGAGRVVTGKFSHKSGDVIDLVLAAADQESETIGTTSNHPFWSEDRRDYVQAGSLEEGERVLTFAGDTKRVVSKLARPGPQPVYNLEVHGEHVYHVGKDGVLVHNEYTKDFGGGVSYRDSLDEFGAPKGLETPEMKRYREYWEGKGDFQHSNQSAPFSIKKSYHPDGNVKTVTTYDQNGNAYRQYVVSERGHDFHQHRYEVNTTKPNPNRKSIDSNAPRRLPGERVND